MVISTKSDQEWLDEMLTLESTGGVSVGKKRSKVEEKSPPGTPVRTGNPGSSEVKPRTGPKQQQTPMLLCVVDGKIRNAVGYEEGKYPVKEWIDDKDKSGGGYYAVRYVGIDDLAKDTFEAIDQTNMSPADVGNLKFWEGFLSTYATMAQNPMEFNEKRLERLFDTAWEISISGVSTRSTEGFGRGFAEAFKKDDRGLKIAAIDSVVSEVHSYGMAAIGASERELLDETGELGGKGNQERIDEARKSKAARHTVWDEDEARDAVGAVAQTLLSALFDAQGDEFEGHAVHPDYTNPNDIRTFRQLEDGSWDHATTTVETLNQKIEIITNALDQAVKDWSAQISGLDDNKPVDVDDSDPNSVSNRRREATGLLSSIVYDVSQTLDEEDEGNAKLTTVSGKTGLQGVLVSHIDRKDRVLMLTAVAVAPKYIGGSTGAGVRIIYESAKAWLDDPDWDYIEGSALSASSGALYGHIGATPTGLTDEERNFEITRSLVEEFVSRIDRLMARRPSAGEINTLNLEVETRNTTVRNAEGHEGLVPKRKWVEDPSDKRGGYYATRWVDPKEEGEDTESGGDETEDVSVPKDNLDDVEFGHAEKFVDEAYGSGTFQKYRDRADKVGVVDEFDAHAKIYHEYAIVASGKRDLLRTRRLAHMVFRRGKRLWDLSKKWHDTWVEEAKQDEGGYAGGKWTKGGVDLMDVILTEKLGEQMLDRAAKAINTLELAGDHTEGELVGAVDSIIAFIHSGFMEFPLAFRLDDHSKFVQGHDKDVNPWTVFSEAQDVGLSVLNGLAGNAETGPSLPNDVPGFHTMTGWRPNPNFVPPDDWVPPAEDKAYRTLAQGVEVPSWWKKEWGKLWRREYRNVLERNVFSAQEVDIP